MTYSEKVSASKTIVSAINRLKDKEYIIVEYGTDYNGNPQQYKINCSIYKSDSTPSYSIYRNDVWGIDGMNIQSLTNTQAKAYTYDMMRQRTTYNFPLYKMTLIEEPFLETAHDLEFVG